MCGTLYIGVHLFDRWHLITYFPSSIFLYTHIHSGHTVICRRCFVKTIQNSVQQKHLPLRCVICREKILRLKQSFTSNLLAESRTGKYKRQTRAYQSTQTYQYTKSKNSKKQSEISTSYKSSKVTSKKSSTAQQTAINQINDQRNAIENKKVSNVENDVLIQWAYYSVSSTPAMS